VTHRQRLESARTPGLRAAAAIVLLLLAAVQDIASAAVREPIDTNAYAVLRNGRALFLECQLPQGNQARAFLMQYLKPTVKPDIYENRLAVAIPYYDLSPAAQRKVILALWQADFVDDDGWHHTVAFTGEEQETLWSISEWLTGRGTNAQAIQKANGLPSAALRAGQRILIPRDLLLPVMRRATPRPETVPAPSTSLAKVEAELEYITKGGQQFAVYKIKQGEALYSAVGVRFTNYELHTEIQAALDEIIVASDIKNPRFIKPGTKVYVPVAMLADRFRPAGSPEREVYEEVIEKAKELKAQAPVSKDLSGVVVVLDPGHGGDDPGTRRIDKKFTLYEDEIAYDIVCRIKKKLEAQTAAKVYVTMYDPSQQYEPTERERFEFDKDEMVMTNPPYVNGDARFSANLRWYLANSIYRKEIKAGTDPNKIIFTSVHCDALFNDQMRGTMIYVPGAQYRQDTSSAWPPAVYAKYSEVKEQRGFSSTIAERKRDEALSRNFAQSVLDSLSEHRIKRHDHGDPIRNVIWRNRNAIVPAVLRNNEIPTKILIESANLTNDIDCERVSQPWWRDQFADAYVAALKKHFS
jgi:N-acetylmuramoyl-L-alanine amidase